MREYRKYLIYTLALFFVVSVFHAWQSNWKDGATNKIINSDGISYYAHLTAIFIYDLDYSFVEKKIEQGYIPRYAQYYFVEHSNGKIFNKTFFGNALMLMPGFLIAMLLSYIFKQPVDGYNAIFQISVNINSILFTLLGLYLVGLYLKRKGFSLQTILLVLTGFYFGSNLYYYTLFEPAMTHQYLFFLIALFFYQFDDFFSKPTIWRFLLISSIFALIIMIRPATGIIVVLVPFFFNNWKNLINFIKANRYLLIKSLIFGFLAFIAVLFIQLIVWKADTGNWLVYGYGDKGFNFLSPKMLKVLFSYKKGLFVYTPITFISFFGYIYLFRQNKYKALVLFLAFLIITYVLSSWWSWYYGGSYGLRAYIDYYIIFMIPLAYLVENLKQKWGFYLLFAGIVAYTQIQIYQYKNYIIDNFGMTKQNFWEVFLKTKADFIGYPYRKPVPDLSDISPTVFTFDFENESIKGITSELSHSGKKSLKLDLSKKRTYAVQMDSAYFDPESEYFVEISFWRYGENSPGLLKAGLTITDEGKYSKWITHYMQDRFYKRSHIWKKMDYFRYLGNFKSENNYFKFYFYSENSYYIDDLEVKFYPVPANYKRK